MKEHLGARVDAMIWRTPDALATAYGWQITRTGAGRRYRDPRFDHVMAATDDRDPERFIAGEGFPRNHPKIPPSRGPAALVGAVWRWRIEWGAVAGFPMAAMPLADWAGAPVTALLTGAAVLAGMFAPPVRKGFGRLLVRHRFQGLCLRTSLRTPAGRLPLVIQTSSTDHGVAMLVWLRSGMSAQLVEDYIPEIRVACFATDVQVYTHPKWPQLLTVEVRRA
ncbi:MAG: hypothetical protein HOY71_53980 [Nonomuraea sp.]|nr:hypothetical protein [Nonomuraea sp.]